MSEIQILKGKPIPEDRPHWTEMLRALKVKECFPVPPESRGDVQSIVSRMTREEGDRKFTIRQVVDEKTGKTEIYCWRIE